MTDPFASAAARAFAALHPPSRVLLAVSGGADSVALLDALVRVSKRRNLQGISWFVGHFDHALRTDSDKDAALVQQHALQRNLPFLTRRRVSSLPAGLSLEHGAREARYEALLAMAREADCGAIVTAHTATDQAETFLWRLVRGSGMRGLGAMRPERPLEDIRLLRPLLGLSRGETRDYCARRNLLFVDDPTNVNDLPRARLRAEVLPVLERLQTGAVERIAATATRLRDDDDFLNSLASPLLSGTPAEQLERLKEAPKPLRVRALQLWAEGQLGRREGLSASHVDALERLVLTGAGEVDLPADVATRRVATILHKALVLEARPRVKQPGVEAEGDTHHLPATGK